MNQADVLIVGAGPVGLMLACELRRRDISCRIIDKYAEFPSASRTNGVQPRAVEVLDSLGIADKIIAESYRAKGFRIMRAGAEVGRIEPNVATNPVEPTDQSNRGMVFANQAVVEKVLRGKLAEFGGQVELRRELRCIEEHSAGGVVADIADLVSGNVEQVHAQWLTEISHKPRSNCFAAYSPTALPTPPPKFLNPFGSPISSCTIASSTTTGKGMSSSPATLPTFTAQSAGRG